MPKTTAPKPTPSPTDGDTKPNGVSGDNPRQMFIVAALNMSWQLAVIVLVPVVGGYELDKRWNTAPLLLFIGLVIASIGSATIVWRQLQQFGPPPAQPKGHKT